MPRRQSTIQRHGTNGPTMTGPSMGSRQLCLHSFLTLFLFDRIRPGRWTSTSSDKHGLLPCDVNEVIGRTTEALRSLLGDPQGRHYKKECATSSRLCQSRCSRRSCRMGRSCRSGHSDRARWHMRRYVASRWRCDSRFFFPETLSVGLVIANTFSTPPA